MIKQLLITLQKTGKSYWKEILAVLLLLLGLFFFRAERGELASLLPHLHAAIPAWVVAGVIVTGLYILLQAGMYVTSFLAIGSRLSWWYAIELFLKRNFLSVFLPAGGISSLTYAPISLSKSGISKMQSHQASGIYAFVGLLSVFIVGVPLIIYSFFTANRFASAQQSIMWLFLILLVAGGVFWIFKKKGRPYQYLLQKFPQIINPLKEIFAADISRPKFWLTVLLSIGVEVCGIAHIFIAAKALGLPASFVASAMAYIISVLLMIVSPFLRGLGAVEFSMVYILSRFGYSAVDALGITVLYRLFEFWLPLFAGIFSFAWKGRHIFVRLFPTFLVFTLGIVNILSVLTPPIAFRLKLLREFLPVESIRASNVAVLVIGFVLLLISALLIKGHRSAWVMAVTFSALSLVGNIFKALDYEEAILAASVLIILIITAKQYRLRGHQQIVRFNFTTVLLAFAAVLLFGFIGFYTIHRQHFGTSFSAWQSFQLSAENSLLMYEGDLEPLTRFGKEFVLWMHVLGVIAWSTFIVVLAKPFLRSRHPREYTKERADDLVERYGNSPVDYFKTYPDKLLFFSDEYEAFIAYSIANGFAIVLEEPVCAGEDKIAVLEEFDKHCRKMGLKTAFYRVDESSVSYFQHLKKNKLLIGQEAVLEIESFTLEGRDKKSLRNGLNSLQKKGFQTQVCKAPLDNSLLGELKKVSDEWLVNYDKKEMVFSQGMFIPEEVKEHDVIIIRDAEGGLKAFLNIIPDFAPDECTYDMIRKTADAPGGCMDALIIELVKYAKERRLLYLNLGLVPMTGIEQPSNTAERLMQYAYEKIKRFRHYAGLREFKEKYASFWLNKYLIYENDFDLIQLPIALNKVMQSKLLK